MNPTQYYFTLIQTITVDQAHSLVCIPDRDTAECELTRLRHEYGPRLLKAVIRKDRPPKPARNQPSTKNHHPSSTYTLRYFTRETQNLNLF